MKRLAFRALSITVGVVALGLPCHAESADAAAVTADNVASCVAAHDQARLLRVNEEWLPARAAMSSCADPSCPLTLRSDCSAWLEELAAVLPTLLIVVERDDGGERPVRLEIDGHAREVPADVAPIELLPGRHTLRFSLAGYPPVDAVVELAKGEKNRVVRARFVHERQPAPAPPAATQLVRERPIPLVTYLAAAGALVAGVTSGALLASALSSRADARERCAPECHDGEREAIDTRLLVADIVGGAGLVLGGVAVYTYVTRPVVETELRAARARQLPPLFATLALGGRF